MNEQKLREEWEKATNLDNYEVEKEYHNLILTDDCPYGREWYPESPYELDEERVFNWWLKVISDERARLVEEIENGIEEYKVAKDIKANTLGIDYIFVYDLKTFIINKIKNNERHI